MSRLRVWWIPQVPMRETFYVPVQSPEEGKKIMDLLAAYDAFQLQNRIKPDYCNVGGLQMWDEEEGEWTDWYLETEDDYYEDVDEYCEQCSLCERTEELRKFNEEMMKQVDWEKIQRMTR